MATFGEALDRARQLLSAGDLVQAEMTYRRLIEAAPQAIEPWHELGILQMQAARPAAAVDCLRHAVALEPSCPTYYGSLAAAYRMLQQPHEAVAMLEHALKLGTPTAELFNNLALSWKDTGQTDAALRTFDAALRIRSDYANCHFNRGNLLVDVGRLEEAAESYRRAIDLQPDDAFAHCKLGMVYGELAPSANLKPGPTDALNPVGSDSPPPSRLEQAAACFRRALELKPDYCEAYGNLGGVLARQEQLDEAVEYLRRAVELNPEFAEAHNNLGVLLGTQNRLAEAEASYLRAVESNPEFAEAHYNWATAMLLTGRFLDGWPEYEWRLQCKGMGLPALPQPKWTGSPLAGRTILLRSEQGLGDTLLFIRYVDLVKRQGGKVIVEVPRPIIPLLQQSGFSNLVAKTTPLPDFDVHIPLLSLPGIFSTTLETIPGNASYLSADPRLVEHWQGVLRATDGLKVGIAWQGNPAYRDDRYRSFPLAQFAPLAQAGVELIGLQKGFGTEQLAGVAGKFFVRELGDSVDEVHGPFMDTAAIMKNLDLVVTCDSVMAHLAGALGVPVWLALSLGHDWRWMLKREDTPWYPTMRLFRQTARGDWSSVFQRMQEELVRMARAS